MTKLLFIGGLGPPELLLIAGVLILLFGASKLPKLARSMGSATGEFKKGRQEVEEELEEIQQGGGETETHSDVETEPNVETDADTEAETDVETDRDPEQTGA
jgi:sec-independent protein translocase protein TatA